MAHAYTLRSSRPLRRDDASWTQALSVVAGIAAGGGLIVGSAAVYLSNSGPSGVYPWAWSYTQDGALEVLAYVPAILFAGWALAALWFRGFHLGVSFVAALTGLLIGVMADLVNEVGLLGQLPDSSAVRMVYGVVANVGILTAALLFGLALAESHVEVTRLSKVIAALLVVAGIVVGLRAPLADTWINSTNCWTQGIFALAVFVAPLLTAPVQNRFRTSGARWIVILGALPVAPIAIIAGLLVGIGLTG